MNRNHSSRRTREDDEYGYFQDGKTPGEDYAEDRSFFHRLAHPSEWFSNDDERGTEYNRLNRDARNDRRESHSNDHNAARNTGIRAPKEPSDAYAPLGIRPQPGHHNFVDNSPGSNSYFNSTKTNDNYAGRGPKGYSRSDDRISEEVYRILTEDGEINASNINVSVRQGEVMLEGTVNNKYTKRLAEERIAALPGVQNIINDLKVKPQGNETQGQWYTRMLGNWES